MLNQKLLNDPEVKAMCKDLLLHPKFGAFLEDYSGDPLVNAAYNMFSDIVFPGLTRKQIQDLREYYAKRPVKREKIKAVAVI